MRGFIAGVAATLLSCAHADPGNVAAAVIAVAEAASLTTLNIASGHCATACGYGTYCDEHGMCRAFPCHDSCNANEECVTNPVEHCVARTALQQQQRVEVQVEVNSDGSGHLYRPAPPADPPAAPPPAAPAR